MKRQSRSHPPVAPLRTLPQLQTLPQPLVADLLRSAADRALQARLEQLQHFDTIAKALERLENALLKKRGAYYVEVADSAFIKLLRLALNECRQEVVNLALRQPTLPSGAPDESSARYGGWQATLRFLTAWKTPWLLPFRPVIEAAQQGLLNFDPTTQLCRVLGNPAREVLDAAAVIQKIAAKTGKSAVPADVKAQLFEQIMVLQVVEGYRHNTQRLEVSDAEASEEVANDQR